ncbi:MULTISPECIES: hypothetical protein [Bacillus]|uniref:hypothetical protein n=1 Tax=Bacillus TaxID=1386 RepID=UPI001596BA3C|nr:hypothetical protein [Bacillus thuringiensis]
MDTTDTPAEERYYLSEQDDVTNSHENSFYEGQAVTESLYLGNKEYHFNNDGVCKNP